MVKQITYEGKSYPIRVSYFAMKHTEIKLGRPMKEGDDQDFEGLEALLFYSLMAGHKKMKIEEEFSFELEDMDMMLDECIKEFTAVIKESYPEVEKSKDAKGSKGEKEEPKKK